MSQPEITQEYVPGPKNRVAEVKYVEVEDIEMELTGNTPTDISNYLELIRGKIVGELQRVKDSNPERAVEMAPGQTIYLSNITIAVEVSGEESDALYNRRISMERVSHYAKLKELNRLAGKLKVKLEKI